MVFSRLIFPGVLLLGQALGQADEQLEFFESRVRPVLSTHCFECHGHKTKGGLKLDSREAILTGGDSGAAVVPGKPKESLLLTAVRHIDADLTMPPKKKLPNHVINDLKRWIREGAVWGDGKSIGFASSEITDEQRNHWSFRPVKTLLVPDAPKAWAQNSIDAFVYRKLQEQKLTPVSLAAKRTLIRRATFDLLGLPPSPEEVEAFVADNSPGAWPRLIDRLLESPHYGERWGRHWLDLVRYADTAGDASDFPVPEAYKYRNYVIDSFNRDKPYDQFVREQIAGDLLPASDEATEWEQKIATGYIAISRRIGVSPQNLKHITIEDTLNNLGKTFLGLTIGCARCHDHKFDAIPTADYYALYGIFDSSVYPHAGAEHQPYRRDFTYRIGKKQSNEILKPFCERLAVWDKKERDKLYEYRSFQSQVIEGPKTRLSVWAELEDVREQRAELAKTFPQLEIAFAILDGDAADVHIQKQGDPGKRKQGKLVRRGFLQVLGGQKLPETTKGSGRRELADWLTQTDHPLTARVMVNRIWHYHFGRGLVPTPSDFGVRGTAPSHPELLDHLADLFVKNGWSTKQMHRAIMTSRVYRLANDEHATNLAADPENHFLWRANRRRLDAEQLRDSMLVFSGELDRAPGARHPFPHHLTYFYRQHEPFQEKYASNKRSVYLMQQRIQKNPYLDLFDGPDGSLHFGERRSTVTTLQALYFMNSEFVHSQAEATARSLAKAEPDETKRLAKLYGLIFNRPPRPDEFAFAGNYLQMRLAKADTGAKGFGQAENLAWSSLVRTMLSSNEFLHVE